MHARKFPYNPPIVIRNPCVGYALGVRGERLQKRLVQVRQSPKARGIHETGVILIHGERNARCVLGSDVHEDANA